MAWQPERRLSGSEYPVPQFSWAVPWSLRGFFPGTGKGVQTIGKLAERHQISAIDVRESQHTETVPKDRLIWDEEVPGLARRERAVLARWIVQFRDKDNKQRRVTLGDCRSIPFELERQLALGAIDNAASGLPTNGTLKLADFAELLGLIPRGSNPCKGMRRHQSDFKATYLSETEYGALGRALAAQAKVHPVEVAVLRFLALTGYRKGEAYGLTWSMIGGIRAALPGAKSGPKSIWLGRATRRLLSGLQRRSAFVFGTGDIPITESRMLPVWNAVRKRIRKPKLRIHDLRHSFASVAVGQGHDLIVVGGLLGHVDKDATLGNAHLANAKLAAASERVGKHLGKAMNGDAIQQYLRSKDKLIPFCETRGLDPHAFQKKLVVWRQRNKRRAAQLKPKLCSPRT